jgi:hypothetical protein
VTIAIPSGDMVHAGFAVSLAGLCHESAGMDLTICNPKSSIVAAARNSGVAQAEEAGAEYLLFLDSDMTFPRTTLRRLLDHGRDVVGATYSTRTSPFKELGTRLQPKAADAPPGLVEMTRIPTGCLLIRMAVFRHLSKPYFRFATDEASGSITGEDYLFCDRVRDSGLRVWCDTALSLDLGHIGQQVHKLPRWGGPATGGGEGQTGE